MATYFLMAELETTDSEYILYLSVFYPTAYKMLLKVKNTSLKKAYEIYSNLPQVGNTESWISPLENWVKAYDCVVRERERLMARCPLLT